MKFIYSVLITVIFIISLSCSGKKEPAPVITKNLTSVSLGSITLDQITYDKSGNPIFLKSEFESISISYENNQIISIKKKNTFSDGSIIDTLTYTINYVDGNNVKITSRLVQTDLKFNNKGLIESEKTEISGGLELKRNFKYDAADNLVYAELLSNNFKIDAFTYGDYDTMNNPFYAKAKTWGIIRALFYIYFDSKIDFPISKNNPRILNYEDYRQGYKFQYNYDADNFPIEVTRSFYLKGSDTPPKESDYSLGTEKILMKY